MDKFILERFEDGEMLHEDVVESNQRLFNEGDLDVMCMSHDKLLLFVRKATDTTSGYYIADDGRWCFGTREDAMNTIKRRL